MKSPASDAVFQAASDVGTWTGSVLWDAAEVLSRYLTTLPAEFWRSSPTCCELGCGSGIAGLTAAALSDGHCCITDQHTHLARWNVDQNFSGEAHQRIAVTELSWGGSSSSITATGGPFDLILGSEIVYDKTSHAALAETIAALSHDKTTVLLATQDGGPDDSLALSAPFWRKLIELGFQCEDIAAEDESVGELIGEYGGHPIADYWTSGNRGEIALVRAKRTYTVRAGRL